MTFEGGEPGCNYHELVGKLPTSAPNFAEILQSFVNDRRQADNGCVPTMPERLRLPLTQQTFYRYVRLISELRVDNQPAAVPDSKYLRKQPPLPSFSACTPRLV